MVKRLCHTAGVCVWLSFADAYAALPPLPPDLSPGLSRAASSDVPLPAMHDEGVAAPAAPFRTPPPLAAAGDPDARDPEESATVAGARPLAPPAVAAPLQTPSLEGPPVPLQPPARMSDADAHLPGDADDGRRISLNLQDVSLPAAFDAFARFTNLNIVVSDRVRGTVSLRLNEVRWRHAFDTLLETYGLAMARRDNVIRVMPATDLAARERERFEAHARAADLEPLASRTFELRYPRAQDVQRLLTGAAGQRVLSRRGTAAADARTNLLFVTDLPPRVVEIAALIDAIDRPSRQVSIEARIVEGEQGFSRNLGARLALRARGRPAGDANAGERTALDLAARPLGGFEAATAGFTLFAAPASRLLDVELSALEAQGRGQIVSRPRVVTADRMKAIVEQGAELPYQAKIGNGVSGVQFRRATLKLEVEPQITPDGRVVLDLDVAKDSIGEQTAAGPAIHTKHVQTRVEVEDGGTVVIGGIYEQLDRDDVTRVPLLGKIPVLGALFRHRARREQRSELVVFITPTVVGAHCGAAAPGAPGTGEPGPGAARPGSTRQPLCQ
ncbi:type IV pilus assembly protein PilQ [Burkholderia multivorans]